jgi:hypothetical protein
MPVQASPISICLFITYHRLIAQKNRFYKLYNQLTHLFIWNSMTNIHYGLICFRNYIKNKIHQSINLIL